MLAVSMSALPAIHQVSLHSHSQRNTRAATQSVVQQRTVHAHKHALSRRRLSEATHCAGMTTPATCTTAGLIASYQADHRYSWQKLWQNSTLPSCPRILPAGSNSCKRTAVLPDPPTPATGSRSPLNECCKMPVHQGRPLVEHHSVNVSCTFSLKLSTIGWAGNTHTSGPGKGPLICLLRGAHRFAKHLPSSSARSTDREALEI